MGYKPVWTVGPMEDSTVRAFGETFASWIKDYKPNWCCPLQLLPALKAYVMSGAGTTALRPWGNKPNFQGGRVERQNGNGSLMVVVTTAWTWTTSFSHKLFMRKALLIDVHLAETTRNIPVVQQSWVCWCLFPEKDCIYDERWDISEKRVRKGLD